MTSHEMRKKIVESLIDAMQHPGYLTHIWHMGRKTELCVTYETIESQLELGTGDGKANQFYFSIISHDTEIWNHTIQEGGDKYGSV